MNVRQLQEKLLDLQRRGFGSEPVVIDGKGKTVLSVEASARTGIRLKTEK